MKYRRKILIILLVLFPILIVYIFPRAVRIDRIECANQYGICNEDLMDKLNAAGSNNLHDSKETIVEVLQNDSTINDFSIQYKLPNVLRINVIDKNPKYAISNMDVKTIAIVDGSGEIVGFTENTNLPKVMLDTRIPNVGDSIDESTIFALKLVYGVRLSNKVFDAKIEKKNLFITLEDGVKVIFPTSGDVEILLGSANLLLSRLNAITKDTRIENTESISEIDLRFNNPVVR